MRIIYIITLLDFGGAQVHLLTVASEMGRERIMRRSSCARIML